MLEGIRILDLSRLLPGPYATQILADLGAEVVKVERPRLGDYLRIVPPLVQQEDGTMTGALFARVNRGKRSVGLDYYKPQGRQVLLRLVEQADVLVESFRPGTLERHGLSYADLAARNPRLVYCALSGYGQAGPYRTRAGHDLNYTALSGILELNRRPGETPLPLPVQIADLAGGMIAATQILAALVECNTTGKGRYLDIALYDSVVDWASVLLGSRHHAGAPLAPGSIDLTGALPCYNVYATADDGYMSLAALEFDFWYTFCRTVERPDWSGRQFDPTLKPELAALFAGRTRAEWTEMAAQYDMCLEPVLKLEEARAFPQARLRVPPSAGVAPGLGRDTLSLLEGAGMQAAELQALTQAGVLVVWDGSPTRSPLRSSGNEL